MTHIEFFKLQAKNLLKDFKAKTQKHFPDDAEYIVVDEYGYDENDFSLMKAQHIIAMMGGFYKWTDLVKASEPRLKLARFLFDNRHETSVEDWDMYIKNRERQNDAVFDDDARLEIYKRVFLNMPMENASVH